MKYVSIDVETTGLNETKNQLLEMGAVVEDTEYDKSIDQLPSFRAILVEPTGEYQINTYVMRMHTVLFEEIDRADQEKLKAHGYYYIEGDTSSKSCVVYCYSEKLQKLFHYWCKRNDVFTDKGEIIAAGKNFYGFDYLFISPWMPEIKFHRRALDPVMYFIENSDRKPPDLETCCQRAGIDLKGFHTAVGDAQTVIKLIRRGRD